MSDSSEQYLQQAIDTLSQSDPLIKLLQQVRQGRMQAGDPGLRAITEAWLSSYRQVLEKGEVLDQQALRRLDPSPRLELLIEAGIMPADHQGIEQLRAVYREALTSRSA